MSFSVSLPRFGLKPLAERIVSNDPLLQQDIRYSTLTTHPDNLVKLNALGDQLTILVENRPSCHNSERHQKNRTFAVGRIVLTGLTQEQQKRIQAAGSDFKPIQLPNGETGYSFGDSVLRTKTRYGISGGILARLARNLTPVHLATVRHILGQCSRNETLTIPRHSPAKFLAYLDERRRPLENV